MFCCGKPKELERLVMLVVGEWARDVAELGEMTVWNGDQYAADASTVETGDEALK